jgi:hypothetical protein
LDFPSLTLAIEKLAFGVGVSPEAEIEKSTLPGRAVDFSLVEW